MATPTQEEDPLSVQEAEPAPDQEEPDASAGPHDHELAQRHDWPWLPTQTCGHLAPHPYCTGCGQVQAVGTGRALDQGGLVNLMANLGRKLDRDGHRLTAVQRRLIMQQVEAEDLDDNFALTRELQFEQLAEIVSRYTSLSEQAAHEYICSC